MEKEFTTLSENGFAIKSGYLTIYRAKESTGEFVGTADAYLVAGTGCAANEYPDSPQVSAGVGCCIVRSQRQDCWELAEDHRGETCYDKATGQRVTIAELGPIPDSLTDKEPVSKYDEWGEDKSVWVFNADKAAADQEASVQAELNRRLNIVRQQKAILSDAIEGGWSDDPEQDAALLAEYKKCEYQLNKVPSQPGYPENVVWPPMPGETPPAPQPEPEKVPEPESPPVNNGDGDEGNQPKP